MSAVLDAGAIAKTWLATLGMLAVQGTLLSIIALALTRVGRLRPAWQAAIWLVVAVKFALPWGPAMPWSLSDLVASLSASDASGAPILISSHAARVAPATPAAWPAVGWIMLASLWALGAMFVLARATLAQVATARFARRAPLAPATAQELLAQLAAHMRVRAPRLALGGEDVGPHVVGVMRPIIVVPPQLLDDAALLRAALVHELAHVRRRDALARIVQIAAGAMMWWWPVVRLVHRRLELAREAACDAWALESGEVARPAYARMLVRMAQLRTVAAPALAAHYALDARVASVLGPPVRARMTHLHRALIAGWALVALGGAREATAQAPVEACQYTPQLATALIHAFPQADLDGDGQLSRDEACDLQAELRRLPEEERSLRLSPEEDVEVQTLLADPLCCNCSGVDVFSSAETATCQRSDARAEGADR